MNKRTSVEPDEGTSSREPVAVGVRRWIARIGLAVMGVSAPLGSAAVGLAVWLFTSPVLFSEVRVRGKAGPLTAFGVLGLPAAALVGAALLSTVFADDVLYSAGHVLGIALMAALGLLGGRAAVRERTFFFDVVMPLTLLATAACAAWATYEHFVLDARRATALLSYTNRLATLLVFFGVLGVGFLLQRGGKLSWLTLPFGLLVLGGIGATMSRAGWAAAALGIALFGLRGGRRFLVASLIAFLLFAALLVVEDDWAARFATTFSLDANQDRIVLWMAALEILRDNPVLGTGPGSFLYVSDDYIEPARHRGHATPHNIVLSVASDLGVVGLLTFGWLMFGAARAAWYLWRLGGPFYTGLVVAVVCIFFNDLFGQGFYTVQTGTVMWFALGLLAAFYEVGTETSFDAAGDAT